jgi:hypothetical protein
LWQENRLGWANQTECETTGTHEKSKHKRLAVAMTSGGIGDFQRMDDFAQCPDSHRDSPKYSNLFFTPSV